MKKHFLVAGGAGFIGSHIADKLIDMDYRVTVIDNLVTGSKDNILQLLDHDGFEFIESDITDKLPYIDSVDEIIHLATIANPTDYERTPYETLIVNSIGCINLLELARSENARFYYFSSSEVYGDHDPIKKEGLKETDFSNIILNKKRSPYYVGKMYGEELTKVFCDSNDIDCIVIRPFNIYGERMDSKSPYGRVIPNFIKWALDKQPLQVNGDGKQQRAFCHVEDFINALFSIIDKKKWEHRIINIGNPEATSIIKLAEIVNEVTGNMSGIVFKERYKFEPFHRKPNITIAKRWLGWGPEVELNTGIRNLIEGKQYA